MKASKVQKLCFFLTLFFIRKLLLRNDPSGETTRLSVTLQFCVYSLALSHSLSHSLALTFHSPGLRLLCWKCIWRRPFMTTAASPALFGIIDFDFDVVVVVRTVAWKDSPTRRQRRALTPWPHRKLGSSLCQPGHTKTLWQRWALQCGPLTQKTPFDEN